MSYLLTYRSVNSARSPYPLANRLCYARSMALRMLPPGPGPTIFDDPGLDPEGRLGLVLEALRRAKDEWDECCRIADDIDPQDDADLLEQARKNIRNAYRRWSEIADQAQ